MLSQLKDRVYNKIKDLGPQDELDRAIATLVERGTSEQLLSADWSTNMELVDIVNRHPEQACEKVIRIVARTYGKPNAKVQILALTMLDTCMRNCHPMLHVLLPTSVLWADLVRQVQDISISRIDAEVRDKILAMIEDYGKYLKHPPTYAEVYESFVDKGLDFPVRNADDLVPIEPYQPPAPVLGGDPASHAPVAAAAPGGGLGGLFAGLTAGGGARAPAPHRGATAAVPAADPYAGLTDEDKAAVMAALAEMDLEDSAAREAAAVAAAADAAEHAAAAQTHPAGAPLGAGAGVPPAPAATAVLPPMPVVAGHPAAVVPAHGARHAHGRQQQQPVAPEAPPLPEDPAEALQVISNSVTLFSEMVGSVPEAEPSGVRDPIISELADTCGRYRSKLMELAGAVSDEGVLVGVLAQNDALATAMARYDELLARALSLPPAPATHLPVADTAVRAAAVASAIGSGSAGLTSAGPAFTLDDGEEEEEEEAGSLATRRQPAAPLAVAAAAPPAPTAAADPLGDLLGIGEAHTAAAPTAPTTAPVAEDLLGGLTLHTEVPAAADAAPPNTAAPPVTAAPVADPHGSLL